MKKYNFGISLSDFKISEWEEELTSMEVNYLSRGFYDDVLKAIRGESGMSKEDARLKARDYAVGFSNTLMQAAQVIGDGK